MVYRMAKSFAGILIARPKAYPVAAVKEVANFVSQGIARSASTADIVAILHPEVGGENSSRDFQQNE